MISNTGTWLLYISYAVIKTEKLMLINPEFRLPTICRIMYCMVIINTEQWFTFQNVFYCSLSSISIMFELKLKMRSPKVKSSPI